MDQHEVPPVEKRAELITKLRGTMEICTLLRDAAGSGVVEALIAKGYGIIGDSTRYDPLGDGNITTDTVKQDESETVVVVAGPFYMRGDINRAMSWARMSGMEVLACVTQEFMEGLEAAEPVDMALRKRFGEVGAPEDRAKVIEATLSVIKDIMQERIKAAEESRERCNNAQHVSIKAELPDASVEVELCMACAERYIAGDTDALDIMEEPMVRRAVLAAFIALHPQAELPSGKLEAVYNAADPQQNAPSTNTKQ